MTSPSEAAASASPMRRSVALGHWTRSSSTTRTTAPAVVASPQRREAMSSVRVMSVSGSLAPGDVRKEGLQHLRVGARLLHQGASEVRIDPARRHPLLEDAGERAEPLARLRDLPRRHVAAEPRRCLDASPRRLGKREELLLTGCAAQRGGRARRDLGCDGAEGRVDLREAARPVVRNRLWRQPLVGSHVSVVHASLSSQLSGGPVAHWPVAGSQALRPLQMSPPLHTTGVPAHTPLLHKSPVVQGLPSSQGAVLKVCWQPSVGSHVSVVQGLPSSQLRGAPGTQRKDVLVSETQRAGLHMSPPHCTGVPTHAPFWQVSLVVQPLPSSHGAVLSVCIQPTPERQESVVQGLPSSHVGVGPGPQVPATGSVHTIGAHGSVVCAAHWSVWMQPWVGSQVSTVHALPSSQLSGVPAVQVKVVGPVGVHTCGLQRSVPQGGGSATHVWFWQLTGLQGLPVLQSASREQKVALHEPWSWLAGASSSVRRASWSPPATPGMSTIGRTPTRCASLISGGGPGKAPCWRSAQLKLWPPTVALSVTPERAVALVLSALTMAPVAEPVVR